MNLASVLERMLSNLVQATSVDVSGFPIVLFHVLLISKVRQEMLLVRPYRLQQQAILVVQQM